MTWIGSPQLHLPAQQADIPCPPSSLRGTGWVKMIGYMSVTTLARSVPPPGDARMVGFLPVLPPLLPPGIVCIMDVMFAIIFLTLLVVGLRLWNKHLS